MKSDFTIVSLPPRRSRQRRKSITRPKTKKKRTKISLWREWLVPDNAYHRYVGLRGVYWYWLSRQIRKEEFDKYGVCLTCLLPVLNWETDGQCGHVIPSQNCGEYLRLNRKNLTLQHSWCNNPKFTPNAGILNALHYNQRYGKNAIELLIGQTDRQVKEPTQEEYRELIRALPSYKDSFAAKAVNNL